MKRGFMGHSQLLTSWCLPAEKLRAPASMQGRRLEAAGVRVVPRRLSFDNGSE